jgi:phage shock protein PspC (stress-responsive transcriptional regulator)
MCGDRPAAMIGPMSDTTPGDVVPDESPSGDRVRRPWRRSTTDRYVGGVAGGAARWLDVDSLLVRVGLVVLAVFWPLAVVVHVVLWLLAPSDDGEPALLRRVRQRDAFREVLGAAALAVAVLLMLPDLRPGGSPSLQVGVVLVGVGLALLARPLLPEGPDHPTPPAGESPTSGGRSFSLPRWSPHLPVAGLRRPRLPPRRPRARPFLTPLALSLIVLLVGAVAAFESVDDRAVAPGTIVSFLLVLVGAVLTLSAWWGRSRALILLVPLLVLAWVAFSLTDIPRHPGIGERNYTLTSAAAVQSYALGAGSLRIDAERLALRPGQEVILDTAVTAGRVSIDVPFDVALRLEGRLGLGQVEVWDQRVGAWYRQYDTGPTANRRLIRGMAPLESLCWPVPEDMEGELWPGTASTISPRERPTTTTVTTYQTPMGEPCDPDPPARTPSTITVRFEIGAGTLEVHRVEAFD